MRLRLVVAPLVIGLVACASVKPPRLQVQNLGIEKVRFDSEASVDLDR